jgi:hypothetical protein
MRTAQTPACANDEIAEPKRERGHHRGGHRQDELAGAGADDEDEEGRDRNPDGDADDHEDRLPPAVADGGGHGDDRGDRAKVGSAARPGK